MGVPARYVEGYCIPLSVMSEGQGVDAEYSQWYQGPSQVTEEGVLMVNVTDAQAHAWVEIYLEGYGFVPFEVTPPDFMDETPLNFNFGGAASSSFSRILENSTSARAKPIPEKVPKIIESITPRALSALIVSAPSTAQLVVISGK